MHFAIKDSYVFIKIKQLTLIIPYFMNLKLGVFLFSKIVVKVLHL